MDKVAEMIVTSKKYDNATSCSTENNIIVFEDCYDEFVKEMEAHGAVLFKEGPEEKTKLQKTMWPNTPNDHVLNRAIVAQNAETIAKLADIEVPAGTKVLMAEENGAGLDHPFAGEIRSGYIDIFIVPEELGFAVNVGELLMTECEMVNGFIDPPDEPPHFTRGYGLVFGMSERKAMAMALVDRALQAPEYGEHATGPAQDEEFVLAHADNVEAAGFVSHLKLPHYVDFQAELELLKRLQQEQNHG